MDDDVDIFDVQLCVNVLLGTEVNSKIVGRADVNNDGDVSINDVQQIVIWISGDQK